MADEKERIDWHGPFCDAMQLELKDEEGLGFQREVVLNTSPIALDLLIIKKDKSVITKNDIGKNFKGYNIFEFKSPGDQMGVDTFFKVLGYGCLYKSDTGKENEIDSDDITINLVREEKPKKLIKWLLNNNCEVIREVPGIYRVKGALLFSTQIIVTKELSQKEHLWLRALTKDIKHDDVEIILNAAEKEKNRFYEKYTDSILYLVYNEWNSKNKFREGSYMYEKTMSLFKDKIDKIVNDAVTVAVMEKDAALADKDVLLADKDIALADKDVLLADKDARIFRLEKELAKYKKGK